MSCCSHWQSSTSDLRPETFLTWRALTSSTVKPRDSSNSNKGIQYTPVDSIATVSTPQASSQSAKALRSTVKLGNSRTGSSSRSGGTATKWDALPMSMPAALGWVIVSAGSGLAGLEADAAIALGHGLLHHSVVECGAASGTSSCSLSQTGYRPSGCEPPSRFTNVDDVTQDHANPRAICTIAISVFRGAAFHLATTQARAVFLRRDLRQRADYFANHLVNQYLKGVPRLGLIPFWPRCGTPRPMDGENRPLRSRWVQRSPCRQGLSDPRNQAIKAVRILFLQPRQAAPGRPCNTPAESASSACFDGFGPNPKPDFSGGFHPASREIKQERRST